MKKLGILVIHGMGDQGPDFADEMIEELEERIRDDGLNADAVAWKPVWWAPVLADAETTLWRKERRNNPLDYKALRKFVVHALGDAVAYRPIQPRSPQDIPVYTRIHELLEEDIRKLRHAVRRGKPASAPESPLFIIGHSLGCHIASNYIWDLQKGHAPSRGNDFEDMKTLSGLITFGCNIPLFTLAHTDVQPINFPLGVRPYFPPGTKVQAIKAATKWWNYYDPDDILGWPLKPLSPAYDVAVHEDVPINVGGILSSWNPLSHMLYWTDDDFTKPVARAIGRLLSLL